MSDYLLKHGTRQTPQSERMRSDQVENSAGGFVWAVDEWTRLRRFLILGSQGGSYYASERDLTKQNISAVKDCLNLDGVRTVQEIVEISDKGRAPKNDPALFALATAISLGDKQTKRAAAEALPQVARIGTHLYHFVAYAETMRGWGRTMRWAVSNWYAKNPDQLALQAIKYRQRDGWSHRDLLRLAHPKNDENAQIFDWIAHGADKKWTHGALAIDWIAGFERAQMSASAKETADLVREFKLPREALLTEHLNDPLVWEAMLFSGGKHGMPITALVRNLATMTRAGLFSSRDALNKATEMITTQNLLQHARVHPMTLLVALYTYASGRGFRGSNTWVPKPEIVDALDEGFYLAFDNVETTGKRHLLALDVSGSMTGGSVAGSPLSPREASVAMALITMHAEPDVDVVGFHSGGGPGSYISPSRGIHYGYTDGLCPVGISRRQRLDSAVRTVRNLPFGGTDCALPFLYATDQSKQYDAFIVYTDYETWDGGVHPKRALDEYRQRSGINARSVVVGMVSNGFSIADPNDAGMLDCCGFDTSTPSIISEFVAGRI